MSWLPRRASMSPEGSAAVTAASAYATEFTGVVDRAFPVDDAAIMRVRAAALGAFIETAPTERHRAISRPVGRSAGRLARRSLAFVLVASVGLLSFGAIAVEARPGGPFYPVRLAIESATLASADLPAGWQARLDRLQRRIDESLAAERDGDPGAIAVALGEYRSELAGMTAGLADPERRSTLGAEVTRDLAVVLDIARTYPSEAADLLVADIRAFLGLPEPGTTNTGGGTTDNSNDGSGMTRDPRDGPTADPHSSRGATGNPHDDGTDREPARRRDHREPAQSTGPPGTRTTTAPPETRTSREDRQPACRRSHRQSAQRNREAGQAEALIRRAGLGSLGRRLRRDRGSTRARRSLLAAVRPRGAGGAAASTKRTARRAARPAAVRGPNEIEFRRRSRAPGRRAAARLRPNAVTTLLMPMYRPDSAFGMMSVISAQSTARKMPAATPTGTTPTSATGGTARRRGAPYRRGRERAERRSSACARTRGRNVQTARWRSSRRSDGDQEHPHRDLILRAS